MSVINNIFSVIKLFLIESYPIVLLLCGVVITQLFLVVLAFLTETNMGLVNAQTCKIKKFLKKNHFVTMKNGKKFYYQCLKPLPNSLKKVWYSYNKDGMKPDKKDLDIAFLKASVNNHSGKKLYYYVLSLSITLIVLATISQDFDYRLKFLIAGGYVAVGFILKSVLDYVEFHYRSRYVTNIEYMYEVLYSISVKYNVVENISKENKKIKTSFVHNEISKEKINYVNAETIKDSKHPQTPVFASKNNNNLNEKFSFLYEENNESKTETNINNSNFGFDTNRQETEASKIFGNSSSNYYQKYKNDKDEYLKKKDLIISNNVLSPTDLIYDVSCYQENDNFEKNQKEIGLPKFSNCDTNKNIANNLANPSQYSDGIIENLINNDNKFNYNGNRDIKDILKKCLNKSIEKQVDDNNFAECESSCNLSKIKNELEELSDRISSTDALKLALQTIKEIRDTDFYNNNDKHILNSLIGKLETKIEYKKYNS